MNLKFSKKKVSGILTILPNKEVLFEDEIDNYNFKRSQSMKLKLIMGYKKRRIVDEDTCISDLLLFGMNHLIDTKKIKKEEIDALILVTQSPDHFMPATSYIIHGQLDLKKDVICMDINQGCSGYVIGLTQAMMLLEQEKGSPSDLLRKAMTPGGVGIEKLFKLEKGNLRTTIIESIIAAKEKTGSFGKG